MCVRRAVSRRRGSELHLNSRGLAGVETKQRHQVVTDCFHADDGALQVFFRFGTGGADVEFHEALAVQPDDSANRSLMGGPAILLAEKVLKVTRAR